MASHGWRPTMRRTSADHRDAVAASPASPRLRRAAHRRRAAAADAAFSAGAAAPSSTRWRATTLGWRSAGAAGTTPTPTPAAAARPGAPRRCATHPCCSWATASASRRVVAALRSSCHHVVCLTNRHGRSTSSRCSVPTPVMPRHVPHEPSRPQHFIALLCLAWATPGFTVEGLVRHSRPFSNESSTGGGKPPEVRGGAARARARAARREMHGAVVAPPPSCRRADHRRAPRAATRGSVRVSLSTTSGRELGGGRPADAHDGLVRAHGHDRGRATTTAALTRIARRDREEDATSDHVTPIT